MYISEKRIKLQKNIDYAEMWSKGGGWSFNECETILKNKDDKNMVDKLKNNIHRENYAWYVEGELIKNNTEISELNSKIFFSFISSAALTLSGVALIKAPEVIVTLIGAIFLQAAMMFDIRIYDSIKKKTKLYKKSEEIAANIDMFNPSDKYLPTWDETFKPMSK